MESISWRSIWLAHKQIFSSVWRGRKTSTYTSEKLEAFLEAIDEEIWNKDVRYIADVDALIRKLEEEPSQSGIKSEKWKKLCKSKRVKIV